MQVDPFLDVIDDHKLQAVSFAPDNLIAYGSKEDTDRALETLSELSTFNHQDQELFVSEIVRSLVNLSEVKLLLVISKSILFWTVCGDKTFAFLYTIILMPFCAA